MNDSDARDIDGNNLKVNLTEANQGEKEKKFIKASFLLFGIGGLLAWNTILADLGFFEHYFITYDPKIYFPFFNFLLNIGFQLFLLVKKKTASYKTLLLFTLTLSIISLISLPAIVAYIKNELYSFIFSSINMLLQGFINAVCLSSFFGLASYFPAEFIIIMSTGQGIAGIMMNAIQFIILFTLPPDQSISSREEDSNLILGTWIFFCISSLILVFIAAFVYFAYQNNYFRAIMANSGEFYNEVKKEINDISSLQPSNISSTYVHPKSNDKEIQQIHKNEEENNEDKVSNEKKERGFKDLIVSLWDLNGLIVLNYIITFALFPGSCLKCPFFKLDMSYVANSIVTIYNISDTIGRKTVSYFTPSKAILASVTLMRILFCFTIPLNSIMANNDDLNIMICSIAIIVNMFFFGFTNGMTTSLTYALAPTVVEEELKGKSGSSISFFNIVGIFLGTCAAFGMNAIIDYINPILII